MDIPRYLRIGPFNYTVQLHDGYRNSDGELSYGEVDEARCTIHLNVDASPEIVREAILHEVLHAILIMYERDDEELVRLLSPMLLQFMRDNSGAMLALTT